MTRVNYMVSSILGLSIMGLLSFLWFSLSDSRQDSLLPDSALNSTDKLQSHMTSDMHQPIVKSTSQGADIQAIKQEVMVLRNQIDHMRKQQNELATKMDNLASATVDTHSEWDTAAGEDPELVMEELMEAEMAAEELMNEPLEEQLTAYADRFHEQEIDPDWSSWAQSALQSGIEGDMQHHQLKGASLLDVECRSTLCWVEVGFENENARDAGLGTLPFVIPWGGQSFLGAREDDPLTVVLYVAREGETLPRHE